MARHQGTDSEPLIIDRAAAAEIPSADAIREWAREKRWIHFQRNVGTTGRTKSCGSCDPCNWLETSNV
jgi:hypothetical protein